MTVLAAPVWFTPEVNHVATLLKERPGHPVSLGLVEPPSESCRHALATIEVPPGSEYAIDLPAGYGLWPLEEAAAGLGAALWDRPSLDEAGEFLLEMGLRQAAWLSRLCSVLAVPVRGCRVTWSGFVGQPCRKFHRDSLLFRIVTTFQGPGTEWGLAEALLGCEETPDGLPLQRAALYEPLVLPGKLAPEGIAPGVIHRSPRPVEDAGRLVLRVDALPMGAR